MLSYIKGTFLVQISSSRDYSDVHIQLMDDLMTLKLDQANGRMVEFPLISVSKVYRIARKNDQQDHADMPSWMVTHTNTEQVVAWICLGPRENYTYYHTEKLQIIAIFFGIGKSLFGSLGPQRAFKNSFEGL